MCFFLKYQGDELFCYCHADYVWKYFLETFSDSRVDWPMNWIG